MNYTTAMQMAAMAIETKMIGWQESAADWHTRSVGQIRDGHTERAIQSQHHQARAWYWQNEYRQALAIIEPIAQGRAQ